MDSQPMENKGMDTISEPLIRKKRKISLVWIIPIITLIVGGWLIYKTISEKGPIITITFKTAEGIEAGKTKIKYKDIEIGIVKSVYFNKDFSTVILEAEIAKKAEPFLKRDTKFWVVKPKLSMREVSNLSTLVSGVHIEIEPGPGASQYRFIGLEIPPAVKADEAGVEVTLLTEELGSVDVGSPIYYRGILAGEILGWELGNDKKSIFIRSFIKAPYDRLIKTNTRFWNVSGIDVSMGADGIRLRTASVESLIYGGVAFETPLSIEENGQDVNGVIFTLYSDYDSIQEQSYTKKVTFILFFTGSVRGLTIDAPVEFKGIKIGSVRDIRLHYDEKDLTFRIPVLIEIEPERIISQGGEDKITSPLRTLQRLVEQGLRARLQTGNLLTGQLYVELDMHPDTESILVAAKDIPYPELPTIPASFEQITTSVKEILTKLEQINIDGIGNELHQTLQNVNSLARGATELIEGPNVTSTLDDLKDSMLRFRNIIAKLEARIDPLSDNLEKTLGEGYATLAEARETLDLMNQMLVPESPFQYEVIELADELAETARSIRILVDLLERRPNALIFGKQPGGEQ
ncbi:MlaD family protein [Desulfobacterales bacterium HSG17]|nr:MlaD family protein [Desulfobacterales bacterium HSG17]